MTKITKMKTIKLLLVILLVIISSSTLFYAYSYSRKCEVCINDKRRTALPNNAWRDFGTPIIHKDGKAYATYKCASGHKFLVDLGE